jgi:hypothetical protein
MKIWCYAWAYVFEVLALLDRVGDWMVDQVDHNDYLAGFLFAVVLFAMVYLSKKLIFRLLKW